MLVSEGLKEVRQRGGDDILFILQELLKCVCVCVRESTVGVLVCECGLMWDKAALASSSKDVGI